MTMNYSSGNNSGTNRNTISPGTNCNTGANTISNSLDRRTTLHTVAAFCFRCSDSSLGPRTVHTLSIRTGSLGTGNTHIILRNGASRHNAHRCGVTLNRHHTGTIRHCLMLRNISPTRLRLISCNRRHPITANGSRRS